MVTFKNKTVLITGGGSGIGEAIAYQFASRGCNVIITGRREDRIRNVAAKCNESGVRSYFHKLDLEDSSSIDELVDFINKENIILDFLVLNAGISQRAMTLESDISVDRKLMEVNYFGGVYLVKSLKRMLLESKDFHIAVTTSISGVFGFPLRSAYCASKRALFGFYETLNLEYPHIKVTFLIPGRIRTEISKSAIMANGEAFNKMDPGQANGMDVDKCAKIAVKAIAKEKHKKLIGGKEILMTYFYKFWPWLFYKLARKVSAH